MRLVPVTPAAIPAHSDRLKLGRFELGRFELGRCVNPRPVYYHDTVVGTNPCGTRVPDDGRGFADLDGAPFKAYICHDCAKEINRA